VNNVYVNGARVAALKPDGEARYYLTDQVDSVKVVLDDEGNAITRFEYLPYGEEWITETEEGIEEEHNPKFNGQELDKETGYYYYNARHYDPGISRFVTADNVIDGEYSTQGWNRYMYCHGNPIIYKDPTGHIAFIPVILGAISIASTVLSYLSPLNDKEYEGLNKSKGLDENIKKGQDNNPENLLKRTTKDKLLETGAREGTDKVISEIRKEGMKEDVIKQGHLAKKELIDANKQTYRNITAIEKNTQRALKTVSEKPSTPTAGGKAWGPVLDIASVVVSHVKSHFTCKEEGVKWDKAVNESKQLEKEQKKLVNQSR